MPEPDSGLFRSWAVSWTRHGRQYLIDTDSREGAHATAVRLEESGADTVLVTEVEGTGPSDDERERISERVRRRLQSDAVIATIREAVQ